MNGDDVWVIECRGGACLLPKALYLGFVMREVFWQKLEGNAAAKHSVLGQIDSAHATRADQRKHTVACNRPPQERIRLALGEQPGGDRERRRGDEPRRLLVRCE